MEDRRPRLCGRHALFDDLVRLLCRRSLASLPWMPPVNAQVMTTGSVLG